MYDSWGDWICQITNLILHCHRWFPTLTSWLNQVSFVWSKGWVNSAAEPLWQRSKPFDQICETEFTWSKNVASMGKKTVIMGSWLQQLLLLPSFNLFSARRRKALQFTPSYLLPICHAILSQVAWALQRDLRNIRPIALLQTCGFSSCRYSPCTIISSSVMQLQEELHAESWLLKCQTLNTVASSFTMRLHGRRQSERARCLFTVVWAKADAISWENTEQRSNDRHSKTESSTLPNPPLSICKLEALSSPPQIGMIYT